MLKNAINPYGFLMSALGRAILASAHMRMAVSPPMLSGSPAARTHFGHWSFSVTLGWLGTNTGKHQFVAGAGPGQWQNHMWGPRAKSHVGPRALTHELANGL